MPLPSNSLRRARPLLGTLVEISVTGGDAALPAAIEAGFGAILEVQRLMSFHEADSDVSRINAAAAGAVVDIDSRTYDVLQFAHQVSELSDGAFDVTTAAILVRNGFLPEPQWKLPSAAATYRDLDLLPGNKVRWRQKGWIDLGGIAKGYAVDCAIAALKLHDVSAGIVNAGGDLRCFGTPQPIYVRQPHAPASLAFLGALTDGAIATSAGYFAGKTIGRRRVEPLVDPRHSACTTWDESVSVAAQDCMTADAMTKVVRLAPAAAPDLLGHFHAQAVVVDVQAKRTCGVMLLQEDMPA